jgi:hypothetical protein
MLGEERVSEDHGRAHDEGASEELTAEERAVLVRVAKILRRLKFGTILLVVQDGKVVQIEMAEKFRIK